MRSIFNGSVCTVVACLLALGGGELHASEPYITAAEAQQGRAVQLSADELKALLKAGSVSEYMSIGSQVGWLRRWHIAADGSLIISNRDVQNKWSFAGRGTWRVRDDGAYCLAIQWHTIQERWCRAAYRVQDSLYLGPLDLTRDTQAKLGRLTIQPAGRAITFQDQEWIGNWAFIVKGLDNYPPWEGTVMLSAEGGSWQFYYQGAPKFAPCFGKPFRLTKVQASSVTLSFEVQASEVVRDCENIRVVLFKVDEQTLEGQLDSGGPIRLMRR